MNYTEALVYLDSFVNLERNLTRSARAEIKLDRVVALAAKLGNPQDRIATLHVAGTKGKGSTSAFTMSILAAAGLKAGLFISPHLEDVRERIGINGRMIPEADFARTLENCRPVLEEMRRPPAGERRPTYFEVLTHLAFTWFAEQKVDAAVIEVGLGGRLDATNIVKPLACAITNISFDHMAILGDTLPQIARDKAGIIKPGAPVVSAPQAGEVARTLDACARAAGVPLEQVGREIEFSELPPPQGAAQIEWPLPQAALRLADGTAYQATLGLRGSHQVQNWAVAVRLADHFFQRKMGRHVPHEAVCEGSRHVYWPGRLEEAASGGAKLYLDGAHNDHSLSVILREVRAHLPARKPLVVLFACAKDKDWGAMLKVLKCAEPEQVLFTHSGNTRGKDPRELAAEWKKLTGSSASVHADCRAGLAAARELAGASGVILATGSLYLVGAVRATLK